MVSEGRLLGGFLRLGFCLGRALALDRLGARPGQRRLVVVAALAPLAAFAAAVAVALALAPAAAAAAVEAAAAAAAAVGTLAAPAAAPAALSAAVRVAVAAVAVRARPLRVPMTIILRRPRVLRVEEPRR